ncbi:hypothetical protein CTheo_1782 [Ceratobasidium theobromae]|uniref:Transmembrane protein n=1 Tax=Ceratobasidium theobromae TaxID=1582974 RepID=A0A5N5QTC0_9AGAM|nr:hypothetical protein CTheo_1782 [Ceratobasidium theobromae]
MTPPASRRSKLGASPLGTNDAIIDDKSSQLPTEDGVSVTVEEAEGVSPRRRKLILIALVIVVALLLVGLGILVGVLLMRGWGLMLTLLEKVKISSF